ncbi:GFA domain-containing protein [Favolaschia claudopus]|uniref:GFA domain-containing protein n=1 Tax=Favolaschia claudopus TaxID=2862362 RepID=A0AAV9ZZK6_9AGAR
MSEETLPLVDYRGNCHCGAFKFTFKAPELKKTFACNCSICYKIGYLWCAPPKEHFVIVKGDEKDLKSYEFGNRTITHKFCPTCGISVMCRTSDGKLGLNLRTLMDVDVAALPVTMSDMANKPPLYQVPDPVVVENIAEGMNVYSGSCHCGAIGYTVVKPDKIVRAKECNCSICYREAALWIYPPATSVTFKGLESLTEYTFGVGDTFHGSCNICGSSLRERFIEPGRTDMALNVRTLNGFDLSSIEIRKSDARDFRGVYRM